MTFKWLVTGFYIGYFPFAPGTAGSLLGLLLFFPFHSIGLPYTLLLLFLLLAVGVYTTDLSLPLFKQKDPSEIVIDEIGGMMLTLLMIPSSLVWWSFGFLLFRLFDITKPPGVREAEKLPGGWGVMADDLVAAFYTILILRLIDYLIGLDMF